MRYLNKIIFINSARIQYAEIQIDGNVHFIGTQGVGKSTALRALLFFYNADKTKLGISKEKKSFDEYYFPYVNSYIIYEVVVDDASYCVLAFRSQGRVCFRFLGTGYKKEYFISPEGKAYEEWDQIRDALGSMRSIETLFSVMAGGFLRSFGSLLLPKAGSTRIYPGRFRMFF